jgi:hypothetical protein
MVLGQRSFPEGTKIHERSGEFIVRVVELVYQAVKGQPVTGVDQLRARIM